MNLIIIAILIAVLDVPWLIFNMASFNTIVRSIQGGRSPKFRPAAGIPVYLALAYLIGHANSLTEAFLIGVTVYAVYDFTVIFAFAHYPVSTAVADVVWGGVLLAATHWIIKKIDL